jgi:cytochrome c oxidase assembly protein subunit 15
LILISITIIAGGLVAGLHAGLIYNTFPLMGGQIFPPDYTQLKPLWRNIFENESAVQFNHRFLATLSVVTIVLLLWSTMRGSVNKHCSLAVHVLSGLVLIQFALGVSTLINFVPMSLAVLHQFLGLCLFGASTWALWTLQGKSSVG